MISFAFSLDIVMPNFTWEVLFDSLCNKNDQFYDIQVQYVQKSVRKQSAKY